MLGWISRINQRLPPSSYEDPHGDMPVDDEDVPPPQAQQPEPDLDDDPIELNTAGDPPSQPPAQVPVPEGEHDDSDLDMPLAPDDHGGGQPPGGLAMGLRQTSLPGVS